MYKECSFLSKIYRFSFGEGRCMYDSTTRLDIILLSFFLENKF
jgi:hypothetical protein